MKLLANVLPRHVMKDRYRRTARQLLMAAIDNWLPPAKPRPDRVASALLMLIFLPENNQSTMLLHLRSAEWLIDYCGGGEFRERLQRSL